MDIVKKIVILILVLVLSYYFSVFFGGVYEKLFPTPNSIVGAVDLRGLAGLPFSYIFFLTLLLTAFGGEKKYWWMGILLIPAVIFELYFDFLHIYFPIALGLAGSLLGYLLAKILNKA